MEFRERRKFIIIITQNSISLKKETLIFAIIITLVIFGCNPFKKNRVLDYESDLNEIVDIVHENHADALSFDSDDIPEMIDLGIDIIVRNIDKKNNNYLGFVEENDSLIIFTKKSSSILKSEKRIIYDFARMPRNFGNEIISGASYEINQLNERWYFSTQGFD